MNSKTKSIAKESVVNLELSKELQELDLKLPAPLFYWSEGYIRGDGTEVESDIFFRDELIAINGFIPAYLSSDLTNLLITREYYLCKDSGVSESDQFKFVRIENGCYIPETLANTEANSKAKFIIFLHAFGYSL